MVDIVANPEWKSVRILERDEVALGGYGGNMNEQATALVARTEFLDREKADRSDIVQGQYSFSTLADFNAVKATLPPNSVIVIDEAGSNQGTNTWDGTTLTKNAYDPLTQAKEDATTKANTAKLEAIAEAATLSSIGEWLTEDGKTTLSTLDTSIPKDAEKLKIIRMIEKIALLNASSSERFYIQTVFRNQGGNGSRIHVQRESQLGTNDRVASLIIADTVTTEGIQEYTVDGTDGIKLKILVNWDNFETDTYALNANLPINNLKFLKEFQNESQLSNVAGQITVAKAEAITEAITGAATDATSKANAAQVAAIATAATDATTKVTTAMGTALTSTSDLNTLAAGNYYITTANLNAIVDAGTAVSLGYPVDTPRGTAAKISVVREGAIAYSVQTIEFTNFGTRYTRQGAVGGSFNAWAAPPVLPTLQFGSITLADNLNDFVTAGQWGIAAATVVSGSAGNKGYPLNLTSADADFTVSVTSAGYAVQVLRHKNKTLKRIIKVSDKTVFEDWITLGASSIYQTVASGSASVADNDLFWVYPNSSNTLEDLTLYKRIDATTSEVAFVQGNLNNYLINEGASWES